jgi:hypothetical protein
VSSCSSHQLEIAIPDKAGHRENAIRIIDNAISEVQAGIDAGAQAFLRTDPRCAAGIALEK